MFINSFIHFSYLFIYLFIYLSIYLYIYLLIYFFIYLFIYLSISYLMNRYQFCLFVDLFIHSLHFNEPYHAAYKNYSQSGTAQNKTNYTIVHNIKQRMIKVNIINQYSEVRNRAEEKKNQTENQHKRNE